MSRSSVPLREFCEIRLGKMLDRKRRTGRNLRPYLRNANVQWNRIDVSDLLEMDFDESERQLFRLQRGDLLVCEGGEVGRAAIWNNEIDECYYQKALHRVRPDPRVCVSEYLLLQLKWLADVGGFSKYTSHSTIAHLTSEKLKTVPIPLPSLEEQRRIVDILSRANGIRRLRREALAKARQLIPALFVEMFGDPRLNGRRLPVVPLNAVSEIGSGVAKGRTLRGETVQMPYLRVANVQDGSLHLHEIKTISVLPEEVDKFRLQPNDLVMTEGGDPDKLGRAAIWPGQINPCLHQNHIFRVRSDTRQIVPQYLRALIGSDYGKHYFLRGAKQTTGIASINKTQLSKFPVVLPPIDMQRAFASRVTDLQSIFAEQDRAAAIADQLAASLMARFFESAAS